MLIDLIKALQAGKELTNAKTWKQVQVWTNNLTTLVVAAVSLSALLGHPIPLTGEQISMLVSGLGVLLGLFNSYTTVATTERIGLRPRTDVQDTGSADGSGQPGVQGGGVEGVDDRDPGDVPVLNYPEDNAQRTARAK